MTGTETNIVKQKTATDATAAVAVSSDHKLCKLTYTSTIKD